MRISGLQKTTLQDFPGHLSAIIFTQGCNYRCPFCHNSEIIQKNNDLIDENEIIGYLSKRKGILEGVVITGGEPTLQNNLKDFIKKIKSLGLSIKLDTNGTNPKLLKELVQENLLDYIAMDIKNSFDSYEDISGVKNFKLDEIKESIKIIKDSKVRHEFRTTIVKEFHNIKKIEAILKYVDGSKYFLQNFEDSDNVLTKGLHGFTIEELKEIESKLKTKFTNVTVRGL